MIKSLSKFKDEIIEVYTDPNDLNHLEVGYILDANKEAVLLENISSSGKPDGFFCLSTEDIIKFETETKYLVKILKLFNFYKQERNKGIVIKRDLINTILNYGQTNNKICEIWISDNKEYSVIGFITDFCDRSITVLNIDCYGFEDGISIIDMKRVKSIYCGKEETKNIEVLYSINKTNMN